MRKILEKLFPLNTIWRLMALVALAAATLFAIELLFGTVGPGGVYRVVVTVLTILSYLLILLSFALIIVGKAKSYLLQGGAAMAIVFILVFAGLLAIGAVQDMAGVHCYGIFGSAKSCIDLAWFRVVVIIFYPLVFLPATLLIFGTLGFGLWDELRQSKKNTKVSR